MVLRQIVQKKGRVVIPRQYREALGVREGEEVVISLEGKRIIIMPAWIVDDPTERLSGLLEAKETITSEMLEEEIYRQRAGKSHDEVR